MRIRHLHLSLRPDSNRKRAKSCNPDSRSVGTNRDLRAKFAVRGVCVARALDVGKGEENRFAARSTAFQKLAQNELQDTTVTIVLELDSRIDACTRVELDIAF